MRGDHGQAQQVFPVEPRLTIPLLCELFDAAIRGHSDKILKLRHLLQQTGNRVRLENEEPLIESTERPGESLGLRLAGLVLKSFQNNVGAGPVMTEAANQCPARPLGPIAQPELRRIRSNEAALAAHPVVA